MRLFNRQKCFQQTTNDQICFFGDNNTKSYLKSETGEVVTGQCHQRTGQIFEIELIIYTCLPQSTKTGHHQFTD